MTQATKVIEEIQQHADVIKQDGPHDLSNMEVGDQWVQGDVRVIRLPDDATGKLDLSPDGTFNGQVAPGTTLGSRHILDSLDGVTAYKINNGNTLDGPVIHLSEPRTLAHPEHGDCCNLPVGWYAFPGQRVYAEELRRVAD